MSTAKFKIGEDVIIYSKISPEKNGHVSTVVLITEYGQPFTCPHTGSHFIENFYPRRYILSDANRIEYESSGQVMGDVGYREESLRKKHDGSSFSFSQLMDTLKQPSLVDN